MSPAPIAPQKSSATSVSEPARATRRLTAPAIIQFVKFGIVGVSNTLLFFAIYTALVKGFGVWYVAASAIGYIVGAVNGFLLNRRWTFREHIGDSLTPVRWTVVQGCGLLANLGLVYLFVDGAGLDELLGQACATAIVTVITFLANRAWTFKMHPPETR
jgi:putative flippase GtrA